MKKLLAATATTIVAGVAGVMAGCGDAEQPAARTVTVVERTVTAAPPPPAAAAPATPPAAAGATSGKITVPNVVGKDHQLAQDTMQTAGLYGLAEKDATGQGRSLIIDRNWTVVSQSPKAGTKVTEDATITLRSKKDGE